MSSTPLSPPPPPVLPAAGTHPRRRRWPYVLGIVALLLGLLVIASLDESPPDLSDLTFEPLPLAPSENAYVLLTAAAEHAKCLLPLDVNDNYEALDSFLSGEAWDDSRISTWMTTLSPVWADYEHAARTPLSQGPIPRSPDDLVPEIRLIQSLGKLSTLRALKALHDGHPDEAISIALLTMESGKRLEESRSSLITYLTGTAIKTKACEVIAKAARAPASSSVVLKATIQQIDALRSSDAALGYTFRNELSFMEGALRIVEKRGISALSDEKAPLPLRVSNRIYFLYKPNQTRRLYAESVREALTYLNANTADLETYHDARVARRTSGFRYNPNNLLGHALLDIVTPTWPKLIKNHATSQSRLSATQALLAVILYQRDHGTPPASLDALVPAYLPSVPRDYLHPSGLRYSADLGVIWSAGENNLMLTSRDQKPTARDVILWLVEPPVPSEK